jgi:ATP-dependent RNA helicase DeaD
MKCTELKLQPEILKGLQKIGYEELTPIQQQTLEPILAGRDLIAKAQTGSGKTAACAIPILEKIDPAAKEIQALILVPTRELAIQYVEEISKIAQFTPIQAFAVYGGFPMDIQKGKLADGVHVLVATPGRLIDLLYNSPLTLSHVKTLVLDEADEMLDMGFLPDVEFVFSCLVHEHQTLLFSATMPPEIKTLAQRYLKNPVIIELNTENIAPETLTHTFCQTRAHHRLEALLEYLRTNKPRQAILFCNSRRSSEQLYNHLKKELNSVEIIHGGLDQARRTSLFRRFKRLDIRYMIATDIASRGLDFSHTSHVINYDFPTHPESYTHRTGRTARMGREGVALTFYTPQELRKLRTLIRVNRIQPVWLGTEPDIQAAPKACPSQKHSRKDAADRSAKRPRSARRRRRGRSASTPADQN